MSVWLIDDDADGDGDADDDDDDDENDDDEDVVNGCSDQHEAQLRCCG